jgi:hypothetical protein
LTRPRGGFFSLADSRETGNDPKIPKIATIGHGQARLRKNSESLTTLKTPIIGIIGCIFHKETPFLPLF